MAQHLDLALQDWEVRAVLHEHPQADAAQIAEETCADLAEVEMVLGGMAMRRAA
jgi:hypothetical protein